MKTFDVGSRSVGEIAMVKTFSEVITLYLRQGNKENKFSSQQRDGTCSLPLKDYFKSKKLAEMKIRGMIVGEDVRQYREWRKTKGIAPATIAREITVASSAIRYCNKELDWELRNPFFDRQYSKADRKQQQPRRRILTPEENVLLLENSSGLLKDLVMFYLETGFRAREALTLKQCNIHGDEAMLAPDDNKSGRWECRYLSAQALEIIRRQPLSDYAFSKEGKPVSYWWLRNQWRTLRNTIGSPDLRLHDLRRTCGNRLRQDYDLETAQSQLGHADKSTTEAIYAPSKVDKVRRAVLGSAKSVSLRPLSL